MRPLSNICGLTFICLAMALLSARPAQADDSIGSLGASVFFSESGSSLVGSLIQLGGHLDSESGELAPAAADGESKSRTWSGMARPQIRSLTTNAAVAPVASVVGSDSRDAFKFSRAALPMLIDSLPGVAATSFVQARPMAGPVVGVRPSYVKAASYR
jgi:hypothetical protein